MKIIKTDSFPSTEADGKYPLAVRGNIVSTEEAGMWPRYYKDDEYANIYVMVDPALFVKIEKLLHATDELERKASIKRLIKKPESETHQLVDAKALDILGDKYTVADIVMLRTEGLI